MKASGLDAQGACSRPCRRRCRRRAHGVALARSMSSPRLGSAAELHEGQQQQSPLIRTRAHAPRRRRHTTERKASSWSSPTPASKSPCTSTTCEGGGTCVAGQVGAQPQAARCAAAATASSCEPPPTHPYFRQAPPHLEAGGARQQVDLLQRVLPLRHAVHLAADQVVAHVAAQPHGAVQHLRERGRSGRGEGAQVGVRETVRPAGQGRRCVASRENGRTPAQLATAPRLLLQVELVALPSPLHQHRLAAVGRLRGRRRGVAGQTVGGSGAECSHGSGATRRRCRSPAAQRRLDDGSTRTSTPASPTCASQASTNCSSSRQ